MIRRIAGGVYLVDHDGRTELLYIAGPPDERWVFWNGEVYHGDRQPAPLSRAGSLESPGAVTPTDHQPAVRTFSIHAPMPARVSRILVATGGRVKKGETLIVLEAMKMELPIRAPGDASVTAIHCREGELVQGDSVLVELGAP